MQGKLSIIIPVFNEAETLPRILQDIHDCQQSLDQPIECIVVDGGSTDCSVAVCKKFEVQILQSVKGRGQQLAAGACKATGEVLLFLHADCRLSAAHCLTALSTIQQKEVFAGGFRLQFSEKNFILRFAEWFNNIRFFFSRIIYGDHGIFISRENYFKAGGFSPQPLFEDVDFSRRLRKHGRVILVNLPLVTSSRRFFAGGVIRTYLKMAVLHILYWVNVSPQRLAKIYQNK
ncbi:MAG: TIGR04283 family arsenosugar biosynthesis glycosyltransferase [bacterium]